ncbi:hypothetical protein [uncultured Martelella sp.]|uniref:hypothetical protein n=1 Tax=uncultured Martelella sp. TaxID=392331 RepID=UPI0029C7E924|nr:hypothetical protein [uncultured Martelella sp.]
MRTLSLLPLLLVAGTSASADPLLPQGHFRTECLPIGKNDRHGFIAEIRIEGRDISAFAQSYAHNDCDVPTVQVDYRGTITAATGKDDRVDFTQETGRFLYTLLADDVTTYYNANADTAGCGIDDWQTDAPRDVTGRTCAPNSFPEAGTVLKDSLWGDDDAIHFGRMPMVWDAVTGYPEEPSAIRFTRVE